MLPWLLAAGLLLAATAAHYAFWTWRLRVEPPDEGHLVATATDGQRLFLGRRRPSREAVPSGARGSARAPVLLIHGLSVNRLFMDFGWPRNSLAAGLAQAGFECFSLDLRGHGRSRPAVRRGWSFDDYVRKDLPAALEAVRAATGASRVLLVGHSQGALIALAVARALPDRVAGVVAMAGPTRMDRGPELRRFARIVFRAAPFTRFISRIVAPWAGFAHPRLLQASMRTRNVDRKVLQRILANAIEPIPAGVARQFRTWIEEDTFRSVDGAVDYRAGLSSSRLPALFVAGPQDGLAPPDVVRASFEAWGGAKELFVAGREGGLGTDYGHGDLIFGRQAPDEVFPVLTRWLERYGEEGRRDGEPGAGHSTSSTTAGHRPRA